MNKKQNWLIYMLLSTIIWSFFPIISGISLKNIPPFFLLMLATFFAGVSFFIVILVQKKLHELRNIQAWKYALFASVLIGVFHYGFYFSGLRYTTPGNAGIIAQTELIFSFFFFQLGKKESLSWKHIGGIVLIFV